MVFFLLIPLELFRSGLDLSEAKKLVVFLLVLKMIVRHATFIASLTEEHVFLRRPEVGAYYYGLVVLVDKAQEFLNLYDCIMFNEQYKHYQIWQ